jgi:uncharacterized protein
MTDLLHFPLITAATAVVLALLQVSLMFLVVAGRVKTKTSLGDGGSAALERRIRMHGNLAENAPLFLVLLGLTELSGDWRRTVPVIAAFFVLCRLAHPIGLNISRGPSPLRVIGAAGTALALTLIAALLAVSVISRFPTAA